MYIPAAFSLDDPAALAAAMRAHPFAMLLVNGEAGPLAAYAPLAVETDASGSVTALVGHIAKANPFWHAAEGARALVVFAGPDGYVSPSFYPSKAEHGRVVPTWNYLRIEARGRLTFETDPARLAPYVDAPTALLEAGRARPWSSADAPVDYIAAQFRGIVGVRVDVDDIQGKAKLSQNKGGRDVAGVVEGLRSDGAVALAELMTNGVR